MTQVFILSRNRPLYLWACLDSLYRLTRSAAEFVLVDSASTDPLVRDVVAGFERRGMFREVVWLEQNNAADARAAIAERLDTTAPFFAFVESDTVIEAGRFDCWLECMVARLQDDPALAMLGSLVETDDFVPIDKAWRAAPHLSEYEIHDITHHMDPERQRHRPEHPGQLVFSPHNPSGRLLVLRTAAVLKVGGASDHDLHERLRELGYSTGISTEVRHRHLSLLNVFDYPNYDMRKRNNYMYTLSYKAQAMARLAGDTAAVMTREPDVHLEADGRRIDGVRTDDTYQFEVPPDIGLLTLVSRRGFSLDSPDRRQLGIAVGSLTLDGEDRLQDTTLDRGWYGPEEGWRWTTGRAVLPSCRAVTVRVVGTILYMPDLDSTAPAAPAADTAAA